MTTSRSHVLWLKSASYQMTLIPQLRGGQSDAVVWVNCFVGLLVKELICLLTTQPEGLEEVWNVLVLRTADPLGGGESKP